MGLHSLRATTYSSPSFFLYDMEVNQQWTFLLYMIWETIKASETMDILKLTLS